MIGIKLVADELAKHWMHSILFIQCDSTTNLVLLFPLLKVFEEPFKQAFIQHLARQPVDIVFA